MRGEASILNESEKGFSVTCGITDTTVRRIMSRTSGSRVVRTF